MENDHDASAAEEDASAEFFLINCSNLSRDRQEGRFLRQRTIPNPARGLFHFQRSEQLIPDRQRHLLPVFCGRKRPSPQQDSCRQENGNFLPIAGYSQ